MTKLLDRSKLMGNAFSLDSLKSIVRHVVAEVFYLSGLHKKIHKGKVVILMYHRILNDDDDAINYTQPGMYVTASSFDKQMKYISKNYKVISLKYLIDVWNNDGLDNSQRYCVVTFDDGWLDNYENAYPIMKEYNIPSTIFLATSFIGANHWFWPDKIAHLLHTCSKNDLLSVLKDKSVNTGSSDAVLDTFVRKVEENYKFDDISLIDKVIEGMKIYPDEGIHRAVEKILCLLGKKDSLQRVTLNWDEVKEMSEGSVTFGSHTCNHKLLTHLPVEEVERELVDSMQVIKENGIDDLSVFCYPNGYYNDEVQDMVKRSGYDAAVTTKYGYENAACRNSFNLRRIGVHNDVSSTVPLFTLHLSGLGRRAPL